MAVVAGVWTGGLYRTPARSGPQQEPLPVLVIDPQSLDLGEVWEDRAFQRSVKVENRGSETVRVEGASCACTGLKVEPAQFELTPGASQEVHVTLDLSNPPGSGPAPRPFTAPLRLRYTTPRKGAIEQSVGELRGAVKPALLTQAVWNLGIHSHAGGSINRRFKVAAAVPLSTLEIELPATPWFCRAVVNRVRDTPDAYDVEVSSGGLPPVGSYQIQAALRATTVDQVRLPPKRVTVALEIIDDVRIEPPELVFGAATPGSVVESRVYISSVSGRGLRVEKVEPVGVGLTATRGERAGEFHISQHVSGLGRIDRVVWFVVRTEAGVQRVRLPIVVVGVESGN